MWSGWNFPASAWWSGGRRPLFAGCSSLQRLGMDDVFRCCFMCFLKGYVLNMCVLSIYIYIYIERERERFIAWILFIDHVCLLLIYVLSVFLSDSCPCIIVCCVSHHKVNPQTENLYFGGFDSSRFGIPFSIGNFPESWTLRFLVCGFLVRMRQHYTRRRLMLKTLRPIRWSQSYISKGI